MLVGGAIGATAFGPSPGNAASTTSTPTATTATLSGTFQSNEDATHEAGESAAREAQETAGVFPTVP
jgi:hypothetical protein